MNNTFTYSFKSVLKFLPQRQEKCSNYRKVLSFRTGKEWLGVIFSAGKTFKLKYFFT